MSQAIFDYSFLLVSLTIIFFAIRATIRAIRRDPLKPKEAMKSGHTWLSSKSLVVKTAMNIKNGTKQTKSDE